MTAFQPSCDLDLDSMTLILDLDQNVHRMYLRANNEASRPRLSKLKAQTGHTQTLSARQTDGQTDETDDDNDDNKQK